MLEAYDAEIKKLIENGFVIEVHVNNDGPHRPVVRQDEKMTKV